MLDRKKLTHHLVDMLEDHPFEIGLSIALVLFGVRSFITDLQSVPLSIQEQPHVLVYVYCSLSIIGGGSVLFGLLARYKFAWAYGAERAGLFISASAWLAYVVAFLFSPLTPNSTLFMIALIALFSACLIRARAIKRKTQVMIDALRKAKADQEGQ